jgi:hypothetical protein
MLAEETDSGPVCYPITTRLGGECSVSFKHPGEGGVLIPLCFSTRSEKCVFLAVACQALDSTAQTPGLRRRLAADRSDAGDLGLLLQISPRRIGLEASSNHIRRSPPRSLRLTPCAAPNPSPGSFHPSQFLSYASVVSEPLLCPQKSLYKVTRYLYTLSSSNHSSFQSLSSPERLSSSLLVSDPPARSQFVPLVPLFVKTRLGRSASRRSTFGPRLLPRDRIVTWPGNGIRSH